LVLEDPPALDYDKVSALNMMLVLHVRSSHPRYDALKPLVDKLHAKVTEPDDDRDVEKAREALMAAAQPDMPKLPWNGVTSEVYFDWSGGMQQVLPEGLFISSVHVTAKLAELRAAGITHVVQVLHGDPPFPHALVYHSVPIFDEPDVQIDFEACNAFIHAALNPDKAEKSQNRVLVHCIVGMSRSASVVLAYMMFAKQLKLNEAFAILQAVRPIVRPNDGFRAQLRAYEAKLFRAAQAAE
jgi:hypothetical protein